MTNLGHYSLHEELGRGSFATVYRAIHGALGNQVAIKVLLPGLGADENIRKRFTQEAQSASMLEHPNIVRILDLDEDNGQVFLAMECVTGSDLKKRAAMPGALTYKELVLVLSQVADALDYAHSHGILHRDVKPSNILLASDGSAHLCDFGLVQVAESSPLNPLGGVAGTAAYISPEQAESKKLDGRADQYSLAVVAYELLVGELPFKGDSSTAVALLHVTRQPPNPCELNPQLPSEVGEVLLKGMAKDPGQRYATCREFTQALKAALEESQLGQYRKHLAEARALLESGRVGDARTKLDAARKLVVDAPDLQESLADLDATSRIADTYEQMLADWQTAQEKANSVLSLIPDYPDPQGIFTVLGLRKQSWKMPPPKELILQIGLGLLVGLPFLVLMLTLAFGWITR